MNKRYFSVLFCYRKYQITGIYSQSTVIVDRVAVERWRSHRFLQGTGEVAFFEGGLVSWAATRALPLHLLHSRIELTREPSKSISN